ncbi:uncharacterized protein LOC141540958 [Sminthopsis crassicaudata]|uniref:uncharacterized protein LOC141540958 n=1 Tax=Sminthopsis crassicaudata TaxID=9301 RepID=UPI003D6904A1
MRDRGPADAQRLPRPRPGPRDPLSGTQAPSTPPRPRPSRERPGARPAHAPSQSLAPGNPRPALPRRGPCAGGSSLAPTPCLAGLDPAPSPVPSPCPRPAAWDPAHFSRVASLSPYSGAPRPADPTPPPPLSYALTHQTGRRTGLRLSRGRGQGWGPSDSINQEGQRTRSFLSPTQGTGSSGPGPSPPEVTLTPRGNQLADRDSRQPEHTGPQEGRKTPQQRQQSRGLLEARALGEAEEKAALQQVTKERDDAIAKKLAVEAELGICRAKLQAVERQLLDVLKEKLVLMEEVEAWKDDIQELVSRQIRSQMQREESDSRGDTTPTSGSRPQAGLITHFSQRQWRWRRRDSGLKQMENWTSRQEEMGSYFAH